MQVKIKDYVMLGALLYAMGGLLPAEARRLVCDNPTAESGKWIGAWQESADPCDDVEESLRAEPRSPKVDSPPSSPSRHSQSMKTTASYLVFYEMESYEAPSPASVNCEDTGGGFICEAWPQGDNITYTWSTSGGVSQPYPNVPSSPMKTLSCNGMNPGGSVTVTVRSPYNVTASATRNLYCGY